MLARAVLKSSFRAQYQVSICQTFRRSYTIFLKKENQVKCAINTVVDDQSLSVQWKDKRSRFHHLWLRHHCPCPECINPSTKQRMADFVQIPRQIKPLDVKVEQNEVHVIWEDGHHSTFDSSWLKESAYDDFGKEKVKPGFGSIANESEMMLWNKAIIEANPPTVFNFHKIKDDVSRLRPSMYQNLLRHGFLFVDDTPLTKEALIKVCQFFGGHAQETLFGPVFALENKYLAFADLGYLHNALQGHTDLAYFEAPAGIQAMHCTYHDGTGGDTLLVDGFKAAKTLYAEDPEAYKILTTTEVPFEYVSQDHIIQVHGPTLELNPFNHELERVRFNIHRIGPFINMNLTFKEMGKFYHAIQLFGSILRRPENELWFKLKPGRVVAMDNRRMIHGRSEVSGRRRLIGSFVAIDDYVGRMKAMLSDFKQPNLQF